MTAAHVPAGEPATAEVVEGRISEGPVRVDVVPLLQAYRGALILSRAPPASVALPSKLPPALRRLYLAVRPAWGCRYFTTRYVRRSAEALERELAGRIAVDEADPDDKDEAEALVRFKSSLAPPPSRLLTLIGLIAAILLSQALLGRLGETFLDAYGDAKSNDIKNAVNHVDLSPDVMSVGELTRALVSASYLEDFVVLLTIVTILYVFGRPLAAGFRPVLHVPRRGRSPESSPDALGSLPRGSAPPSWTAGDDGG